MVAAKDRVLCNEKQTRGKGVPHPFPLVFSILHIRQGLNIRCLLPPVIQGICFMCTFKVLSRHARFLLLPVFFYVFSVVSVLYAEDIGDGAGKAKTGFKEDVRLIAEIPENTRIIGDSVFPLPRRGKVAYVYESQDGFKVCMNDNCGPYVDRVALDMPIVSPDGKHWAAIVQTGSNARVLLNGHLGRPFDMVYGLRFSPDSMRLAYIARQGNEFFVYVNQEKHKAFSFIDFRLGLFFSPDSKTLVYSASMDGHMWHLVKNGNPGKAFTQIKHVTFSPDSKRLLFAARQGEKWYLVEGDEKAAGGGGYIDIKRIRFSPDSNRLVYVARDDDGAFVVLDSEKSKTFDYLPGEPLFSNDGDRLAYAVAEERRESLGMRMVVDGEVGPVFQRIGAYRFSPDGGHFAYMAEKDDENGVVVHDGEVGAVYRSIGIPVFAPVKQHLAYYATQDGQWFVVRNGEKGPSFVAGENPVFCPKGERMAYIAQKDDRYVVVEDDDIKGNYEWAGLLGFSPDGKHMAYIAAEDGEAFLVVDEQKGDERFLSFIKGSPLVFTEENTVQGIALRAWADGRQEFWLIRAEMEKGNKN